MPGGEESGPHALQGPGLAPAWQSPRGLWGRSALSWAGSGMGGGANGPSVQLGDEASQKQRERHPRWAHTEGQASVPGVSSGSLGQGAAGLPGAGRVCAGVRARLLSEQGMAGTRLRGRKGHIRVLTGQERPRGARVGPRPSSCQGHCRCHGAWERAVLRRPLEGILEERAGTALWARGGGAPVLTWGSSLYMALFPVLGSSMRWAIPPHDRASSCPAEHQRKHRGWKERGQGDGVMEAPHGEG